MTTSLLERFRTILPDSSVITEPEEIAPYCREWRGRYHHLAQMVVKPKTTLEVSKVLEVAHGAGVEVIPQTGNTGLVGGQVPVADGEGVILSLDGLNRIRSLSPFDGAVTVEAGVRLQVLREEVLPQGFDLPIHLASEGSCGIGGILATNAGGLSVLAHGMARDRCLGLEVVLADGTILSSLSPLKKRNMGYDWRQLFLGSEGTLGVITAASLALVPASRAHQTALLRVRSLEDALPLLALAQEEGGSWVTAMEVIPRRGVDWIVAHHHCPFPLTLEGEWFVLLELSTSARAEILHGMMEAILSRGMEEGRILDGSLAYNEAQRLDFWAFRTRLSEIQKWEGASIKHDVSVPRSKIPEFITQACRAVEALVPGARPFPFGHIGDGNIHFNVSQPVAMERETFLAYEGEINAAVYGVVRSLGGAVSAEHGIGQLKTTLLREVLPAEEYDLLRRLKGLLDPKGILNPGKMFDVRNIAP